MDDTVFIKEFPSGKHWKPGVISSAEGPQSYHITLTDGHVVRCHVDHIRKRSSKLPSSGSESVGEFPDYPPTMPGVGVGVAVPTTAAQSAAVLIHPPAPSLSQSGRNVPSPNYLQ